MKQLRPHIFEVFRCYDADGPIQVVDDGPKRILYFGSGVEQSVILRDTPHWLTNRYTQAMLCGLIFADQLRHITVLGLGGGSLLHALRHYLPQSRLLAVERRERVIEVAQRYFHIQTDDRLQVECADALTYLAQRPAKTDLLLGDLYHAEGMERRQAQRRFLQDCQRALRPAGVLALNMWSRDQREVKATIRQLNVCFGGPVFMLEVSGGNTIVLALKEPASALTKQQWLLKAREWGRQFDLPLGKLAAGLQRL